MGERRALVIGARNDRFGVLDFVDDVVAELHRALVDTERGACVPALPDGRDLLTGDRATSAGIDSALADAISAAAADQATLFVYFLGHGQQANQDFYLIGTDTGERVDSRTAIQIGQRVKELLDNAPTVDGLMLVLDACHSGAAVTDPVPGLLRTGVHVRLEILAATRDDQTASRGCFTRSIIRLLTDGSPATANEYLTAYDEHSRLREVGPPECSDMPEAVHLSIRGGLDAGLWLGRNRAADVRSSLVGSPTAAEIGRLTRNLVRTDSLRQLMSLTVSGQSPIAISGRPGAGKSALLSALGRVSIAGTYGIDALVTVQPGETLANIAERLRPQLERCPGYPDAAAVWRNGIPVAELETTTEFERTIAGPMANLAVSAQILVGVDGVDLLSTVERRRLFESFSGQPGTCLVVAGREVFEVGAQVNLPDRDPENVAKLLDEIVSDKRIVESVSRACAGDWLLARIVAGLWRAGMYDGNEKVTASDLDYVFSLAVATARASAPNAPHEEVLTILATASVGALMPFEILANAVAGYGRAGVSAISVRDVLVALGELVARNAPGTPDEHAGPAHDRIGAFLASRCDPEDLANAHLRVAETIQRMRDGGLSDAVNFYAQRHLSDLYRFKTNSIVSDLGFIRSATPPGSTR
jgi:Caspase domain